MSISEILVLRQIFPHGGEMPEILGDRFRFDDRDLAELLDDRAVRARRVVVELENPSAVSSDANHTKGEALPHAGKVEHASVRGQERKVGFAADVGGRRGDLNRRRWQAGEV
jgi:hypothetical protein